MVTQYDEKGKIFTTVITKKPVEVIIQTTIHKIIGFVHYRPDNRLIDELNAIDTFLAVTNGKIFDLNGDLLYQADFLTINIRHILWVVPAMETKQGMEK